MNFNKDDYLTVKEAAVLTEKSVSTIKRFANENKGNSKWFRYESLPTGYQKIYISKVFIERSFETKLTTKIKIEPLSEPSKNTAEQQFLEYLKSEIEKKDEQLKSKDDEIKRLLEKQLENVDKLLVLQSQAQELHRGQQLQSQQKQIEDNSFNKKKRWWQRK